MTVQMNVILPSTTAQKEETEKYSFCRQPIEHRCFSPPLSAPLPLSKRNKYNLFKKHYRLKCTAFGRLSEMPPTVVSIIF